jgi:hypothetical protein
MESDMVSNSSKDECAQMNLAILTRQSRNQKG